MRPLRPHPAPGNSTNLSRTTKIEWSSRARSRLLAMDTLVLSGVRVEKVRHDDDGIAQAGGITPTALFPVTPPSGLFTADMPPSKTSDNLVTTIPIARWTHWLSDLRPPPMLPQRLKARPHPFSSRNSTHWRRQLPRDLQMVLPPLRRACPRKSGTSSSRPPCASRTLTTATVTAISGLRP